MRTAIAFTGKLILSFLVGLLLMFIIMIPMSLLAVVLFDIKGGLGEVSKTSLFSFYIGGISQTLAFIASPLLMYVMFERKKRWPLGSRVAGKTAAAAGSPSSEPIGLDEARSLRSSADTPSSDPIGFGEPRRSDSSADTPSSDNFSSRKSRLTALRGISLRFPNSRVLLCTLGIGTGSAAILLSFLLIRLAGGIASTSFHWDTEVIQSLLVFLVVFTLVAVSEEIYSRGYIQGMAKHHWGSRAAILVSSALFAGFHVTNAGALDAGFPLINVFLAGVVLAVGRERTGSLWFGIGFHLAWNYVQGCVFGFPVSGHPVPSLLAAQTAGPAWIHGGSFGAEGSLGTSLVLVALSACLLKYPTARKQYSVK